MVQEVTDQTFEAEVLQATQPVLVDFWAEWCGPCRAVAPHLEALQQAKSATLKVMKLNVDQSMQTPQRFEVRGIPTLILFYKGQPVSVKVGSLPQSALYEWVEGVLASLGTSNAGSSAGG